VKQILDDFVVSAVSSQNCSQVEDAGPGSRDAGSRGVENAGSGGKRGVRWKTRGPMENAGSGRKRGVWGKTRGLVENAGSGGKRGVWWKTRGLMWKTGEPLSFAKICTFLTKMTGRNIFS